MTARGARFMLVSSAFNTRVRTHARRCSLAVSVIVVSIPEDWQIH